MRPPRSGSCSGREGAGGVISTQQRLARSVGGDNIGGGGGNNAPRFVKLVPEENVLPDAGVHDPGRLCAVRHAAADTDAGARVLWVGEGAVWGHFSEQSLQERAFPRPNGAHHSGELPGGEVNADVAQDWLGFVGPVPFSAPGQRAVADPEGRVVALLAPCHVGHALLRVQELVQALDRDAGAGESFHQEGEHLGGGGKRGE